MAVASRRRSCCLYSTFILCFLLFSPEGVAAARLDTFGDTAVLRLASGSGLDNFRRPPDDILFKLAHGLPEDTLRNVLRFLSFRFLVASCSNCTSVSLWGVDGVRASRSLNGSIADGIEFFTFGDRVLTWSSQGVAAVWNTTSVRALQVFERRGFEACRVLPRSGRIITLSREGVYTLWDADSGDIIRTFNTSESWVANIEVFPDEARVLSWGTHDSADVVLVDQGRTECSLEGHSESITAAKIFASGRMVITSGMDSQVMIWASSSCALLQVLRHDDIVRDLAVLEDVGRVVVADARGGVVVYALEHLARLRVLVEPLDWPTLLGTGIAPFPRGDRLITFGVEGARLWNATAGAMVLRLLSTRSHETYDVAVPAGGDFVATCGAGGTTLWETSSGARMRTLAGASKTCLVALGLTRALDPQGFGSGVAWEDLP